MAIQLGQIIGQVGSGIYKLVKGKDVSISDATENSDLFTLGSDLITNGSFSTDTDWSKSGSVTIANGTSNFDVNDGAYVKITQSISYNNNKVYKINISVFGTSGSVIRVRDNTSNLGGLNTKTANTLITLTGSTQNIEFLFVANTQSNEIAIERHSGGTYDFYVNFISLKELDESHFDNHVILIGDNNAVTNSSTTDKTKLSNFLVYIQNKLANATTSLSGLMSSNDKGKLDKISGVSHLTSTAIDISNISTNATNISNNTNAITTNANAIALNTAKTGITAQQASDITTNNAKTGITTTQANAITNNTNEISNLKNDKADLSSPTFTGTIAIPNISNVETAITTNQTNIASNTTAISNKPSTAVTDIDFVPSSASLIHLDTTTSPSGTEKRLSINAGTNLSLDSTSATSFTINAPAFGTSAGTILEGNTTLVNSLVAGTGISISSSSGNVTVTSTATATPAGGNGQIQYNNNGAFGATTLGFSPASGSDPAVLSFAGTLKIHNVQAEDDDRPIISTDNNETTISGRVNIATREIKIQSTQQDAGTGRGDVVYYGSVADSGNLTPGKVYYYAPNGNWTLVNAGAVGTSSGILGVALGTSPTTNGLLVNGSVFLDHHAGTGDGQTLYLSTTDGQLTSTKPTGSNQVRIVGTVIKHHTNRCEVLFDPTNFDGQATNPASSSFADIYSISFEGTPDYAVAELPDNWGKNEGTLSVWVNLNITDNVSKYLLAFTTGDGSFNDFLLLQYYKVTSGRFAIICRQKRTISGTSTEHVTVAQQSSTYWGRPFQRTTGSFNSIQQNYESIRTSDTWTHIAVTWDADANYTGYNNVNYEGNQTIYVNGAKVGEGTGTMPGHNGIGTNNEMNYDRSNDLNNVYLGTLSPSHGMTHMLMDDLAIWNTALDGDNIEAIYNSGTPTDLLTDSGNYDESNNLAGYWKFENNDNDSKGTRNITKYGDAEFVSGTGKTPST